MLFGVRKILSYIFKDDIPLENFNGFIPDDSSIAVIGVDFTSPVIMRNVLF